MATITCRPGNHWAQAQGRDLYVRVGWGPAGSAAPTTTLLLSFLLVTAARTDRQGPH